jgi:uncharacterized protein (DUF58 family)
MEASTPERPSLLDPLTVAKLATMELRARVIVEGALAGRHRSAHKCPSLEFAGHRAYTPGDDWRHVDWKVFARTDRWMVREQQEESSLHATILLDVSRSMAFASPRRVPKVRYASFLSAALAYLLIHRREAAGLGLIGTSLREFLPARSGAPQLAVLLEKLDSVSTAGETDPEKAVRQAAARLPRRSLVLVVSDFLAPPAASSSALNILLAQRHEVAALQVLDPLELDFTLRGDFYFEDLETGERLRASSEDIADGYRRRIAEHQERLARSFSSLGVDHFLFRTDTPLDTSLSYFLQRRRLGSRRPVLSATVP